jgi:hypothetical protein
MKFNRILEQYVRESEALTRIIVKVDPLNNSRKDYRDLDGYEGYILKEENNMWSILFENINIPIADVPFSVIKVVDVPCDETFNNIRMFGLKAIEERKGLTMEIISKIQACNSIDFLEQYLKEEGLNDSEIKDVYKKALLSDTISENVLSTVGKIASSAGKVLGGILQPDYAIMDFVKNKYNKVKDNIKKVWGGNTATTTPNPAQSTAGNITGPTRPPTDITLNVDSSVPKSYDVRSELMTYIQSGSIPAGIYKSYRDVNSDSYYYNTRTHDIIKISPTTSTSKYNIRLGNRYDAAPNPDKSEKYFNTIFPVEKSTGGIRLHTKKLADFT